MTTLLYNFTYVVQNRFIPDNSAKKPQTGPIFGMELLQGDLHQHPQVHDRRLPPCGETWLALLYNPDPVYKFSPNVTLIVYYIQVYSLLPDGLFVCVCLCVCVQLFQMIVNAGVVVAVIHYLGDCCGKMRLPGIMMLGYVAANS